jgi:hypothetical protein
MHHLGVSSEYFCTIAKVEWTDTAVAFKFQSIQLAGSSLGGPLANEYQLSSREREDEMPRLAWFHGEGRPVLKAQHV